MEKRDHGTNANKTPLGRPPPYQSKSSSSSSSSSSLLKPSYLSSSSSSELKAIKSSSDKSDSKNSSSFDYEDYLKKYSYAQIPPPPSSSNYSNSSSSNYGNNSKIVPLGFSKWDIPGVVNKRGNEDGDDDDEGRGRKKKRKSRWMGSENEKAVIPGMPTILPADLPPQQQEAYIAQLQIEELTRKLRTGDLGIRPNPEDRSPSPEPIYGTDGKRLNTREYRTRKKLEEERHKLIQKLLRLNPDYKAPADYRAPVIKIVDRVSIPQEENPEINFVGLLIGPRGNTLKSLEKDTGAKIIIRGKGSVKEGKVGGKAGHPLPGEDEPLHAYVTSNNPESVKKACDKIRQIIRQGVDQPESQNDLRKNQLRELALLNGTLREGEGPKCSNCGATSHRTWNCPDKPNVTASVVCTVCGGAGHIGKDCRMKRPGATGPPTILPSERAKIDEEYQSLMAELGEVTKEPGGSNNSSSNPPKQFLLSSTPNLFNRTPVPRAIIAPGAGESNGGGGAMSVPPPGWSNMSTSYPVGPPPPPPGMPSITSQGWHNSSHQPPPPGIYWNSAPPPPPSQMYWQPPPPPPDQFKPPPPPPPPK